MLTIATRKSPLALWQANFIAEQLRTHWPDLDVRLLPMSTSGDKFIKDKLLAAGGKGLFIKELEEALIDKRADIAVHSMKDVPAEFPEGLLLDVICQRENPFDALLSVDHQSISALPQGAVVGTASLRRASQLLAFRPDLEIKLLRGNIHTRIKKFDSGDYDAIVLAAAGLERMQLDERITELLPQDLMLPACGQGALGIECRAEDEATRERIAPLNHTLSALCIHTERRVNAKLGGNCHVPLAVFCQPMAEDKLLLSAKVLSEDGKQIIVAQEEFKQNKYLQAADRCALRLIENGAKTLLSLRE